MGIDERWVQYREYLIERLENNQRALDGIPEIDDIDLRARKEEPIRDVIYETRRHLRGLYTVFPELKSREAVSGRNEPKILEGDDFKGPFSSPI